MKSCRAWFLSVLRYFIFSMVEDSVEVGSNYEKIVYRQKQCLKKFDNDTIFFSKLISTKNVKIICTLRKKLCSARCLLLVLWGNYEVWSYNYIFCKLLCILLIFFSYRISDNKRIARTIVLDISESFENRWHRSLLNELFSYGINARIFSIPKSFLTCRLLNVVIEAHKINEGVQ